MAHVQRKPFPGRTVPGSAPAQRRPVRSAPGFSPVQRQPAAGARPRPTVLSPGRVALKASQAKDRATLGIGSPGGLTRQGLSAKLSGIGKRVGRVKTTSSPAKRDPLRLRLEQLQR